MIVSTDAPLVLGGLVGFGLLFVPLGYCVRRWWRLLGAEFSIVGAVAIVAVVWPASYEFDTGALLGLAFIPPALIAMIGTGLGVALRSVIAPRPDD